MNVRTLLLGAIALSFAGTAAAEPAGKPDIGAWGVDLKAMDTSVKPGNNFFDYVNGDWLKTAVIPPDRSSTGGFADLAILSEKRMLEIIDALKAKPYGQLTPDEKKLRDLYETFENEKAIDAAGLQPVQADLRAIAKVENSVELARLMAHLQRVAPGGRMLALGPFGLGIQVDAKDPAHYAVYLGQSGLGLPDRDYYLSDNADVKRTREAYQAYLVKMMALGGLKDAQARAEKVYALEAALAKAHISAAERRNVLKRYNPMPVTELDGFAPGFPWGTYIEAMGIPRDKDGHARIVIVGEKDAFPEMARIFAQTPLAVWKDYLTVHYLHDFAAYLPTAIDKADFAFYGTALTGRPAELSRDRRGVHVLDEVMGFALGKLYVAKYFPPEAKAKAEQLVANLRKAYEEDIPTLTWMGPQTKQKALEKLHLLTPHIGYPDKWRDYSAYVVKRGDLIGDIQRSSEFEWQRELKRLDGPVDKDEWGMTPPTVNAYYNPLLNEIVFPAAILQPPFFDPNADDAVNYGGIGAVIGHEMSHGYDDQGSRFNAQGELKNWWTEADLKAFEARTQALGKQYDSYEPLPGIHINGKLTMGENIADLAGTTIAYKAYHISLDGKPAPVLDGFTGDQRFFLSYGQIWRAKVRPDALRVRLLSDPHSPDEFRAIGVTRNLDPWYAAFDVQPGTTYYLPPDQRVHLW